MWVIEDYDSVRKVCATKEIALREVFRMIKDYYIKSPNDEQELKDYRTLMEEYFFHCKDSFCIDEFCWVSKVEFIDE